MPIIQLDGEEREVAAGATIHDLLPDMEPGACVAVILPATVSQATTKQYLIKTTAGELVIETEGDTDPFPAMALSGLEVRWQDLQVSSFGPFPSLFVPARRPARYERGDVILGCGGYDPSQSYLLFSRKTHAADHGASSSGGVIGSVVSGKGVLDRFVSGVRITGIEPVLSFTESVNALTTSDPEYPLEEGMHIISFMHIIAQGYSPESTSPDAAESVEHLLLALQNGVMDTSLKMSGYMRSDLLAGTNIPFEIGSPRREGSVFMRTSGKKRGSVYVYTQDLPRSLSHTLVGQVVHGIELAKIVRDNDRFAVKITPERIDLIGLSLPWAEKAAEMHGLFLQADTAGSESVVVSQNPGTTLEAIAEGSVSVKTVPKEKVIDIKLDDQHAPITCQIFREVTGLKFHSVGRLPMLFAFDDVFLFKATINKSTNFNPENIPVIEVPAGSLAMTNDSCRGVGTVGVRLTPNREFGPTSEPFSGTNIMGKVIDTEKLKLLKEGETVYFREVRG